MNGSAADERLARQIAEAIDEFEPIEAAGYRITVTAKDGVARLDGMVRTEVHRVLAGRIAGDLAGSVENQLKTDREIENAVAQAIAGDPALVGERVIVQSVLGKVRLRGTLAGDHADRAATLARAVPNVSEVVNELQLL